jgi:hypothetical protein
MNKTQNRLTYIPKYNAKNAIKRIVNKNLYRIKIPERTGLVLISYITTIPSKPKNIDHL